MSYLQNFIKYLLFYKLSDLEFNVNYKYNFNIFKFYIPLIKSDEKVVQTFKIQFDKI